CPPRSPTPSACPTARGVNDFCNIYCESWADRHDASLAGPGSRQNRRFRWLLDSPGKCFVRSASNWLIKSRLTHSISRLYCVVSRADFLHVHPVDRTLLRYRCAPQLFQGGGGLRAVATGRQPVLAASGR